MLRYRSPDVAVGLCRHRGTASFEVQERRHLDFGYEMTSHSSEGSDCRAMSSPMSRPNLESRGPVPARRRSPSDPPLSTAVRSHGSNCSRRIAPVPFASGEMPLTVTYNAPSGPIVIDEG